MSVLFGNGREPGVPTPVRDAETAGTAERRPRARRKTQSESFASALEAEVDSEKPRTPGKLVPRKPAPRSSVDELALVNATSPVLVSAPLPGAPAAPKSGTRSGDAALAARPLAPQAAARTTPEARRNPAPDARASTVPDARASTAPEPVHAAPAHAAPANAAAFALDGLEAPATSAGRDDGVPARVVDDATEPSFLPPRSTRDTMRGASPPARAVTAQDAARIVLGGDVPRTTRDTQPAPDESHDAHQAAPVAAIGSAAAATSRLTIPPQVVAPAAPERPELPELDDERPRGRVDGKGADLQLGGEGEDSLSLRITAEKHIVHVHATAGDAAMAEALRASADELRQALGAHGLELGELSTQTRAGSSGSGRGSAGSDTAEGDAPESSGPQEPKPVRRRGVRIVV